MPLEVSAVLDREAAIYLTGEVISVKVTLKNVSIKGRESLAWGSVQLTCERTMGAQVAFRDRPTTAISRSASTVYSSVPNVLFCDVELNHGEARQFSCEISLPTHDLPPSFRGHLVKYINRITIAVQHVRDPIKLIFRIIPSVGVDENLRLDQNPFLMETMLPATVCQTVMATVDEITAPKRPYMFSMRNAHGKVANMTLFKKTFRLGEDVLGTLGFEDSEVPCVQCSVHLETTEQLTEDIVGEHGEMRSEGMVCVQSCLEPSFRLSIPMHAPPTFHTDTVHLKWRLRFKFVTSAPLINVVYGEVCKAPIDVSIETLTWKVDIYVLPCSPQNAALTDSSHSGSASMVL
uniref:Arrestin_N domain-containing protein n=1 Tax=Angiostrongylus cantonensis TaxID=6313 RepID=A0A158PCS2_ANGCA